jgi:sugar O-acyltransferase (sialic acid O-acetyltransferase NeuD family)
MRRVLGFLGGGSQAVEAQEYDPDLEVAFRAITTTPGRDLPEGFIDIATSDPALIAVPVVAAVGPPGLRRDLVGQWSGRSYGSIVSAFSWLSPTAEIGAGCIVAPGVVVTAGARIGSHVILNVGCSVSHTCEIGDFATLSPAVSIGGDCRIGPGTFVGIGAAVGHGVSVAPGTVVGAGSVVLKDIDEAGIWIGSPARLVRTTDRWLMNL